MRLPPTGGPLNALIAGVDCGIFSGTWGPFTGTSGMKSDELEKLRAELDRLKISLRKIAHDMSNPLGVLRMAAYYLQTANPESHKRDHYYKIINDSVTRVEDDLKRLRSLCEPPAQKLSSAPSEEDQKK